MPKYKSDQEIIEELKQENKELKRLVRSRGMTKDETYEEIRKIIGKRNFLGGILKMNSYELDDFLNWLEDEK